MFVNEFIIMFFGENWNCHMVWRNTYVKIKIKINNKLWNNVGAMQKCSPLLKLRLVLASG